MLPCYQLKGMKALASHVAFSHTNLARYWVSHYSLTSVEAKAPHLPFSGFGESEALVFSVVFGWSRVVIV